MSCQMNKIAQLSDIVSIKGELLRDASIKFDNDVHSEELPLQECSISLSSAGDILVLALHRRLVVLTSKWDLQELEEVKNKFHIIWSGYVTSEPHDYITSVICLPLAVVGKSNSRAGVDWSCIVVGFNSGFIRFYTECGNLLYEKLLHNESILSIKCQSLTLPKHSGESGLCEEIHVLYPSVICILSGFSLFSILRACRNHLARVQAHCDESDKYMLDKAIGSSTALNFKKLGFKDQDLINDCELIGITSVNTFDHLMTASICGGYNASYRSGAPQHNLIMATGKRPYIGFHYALEGCTAPVLSEVAIAMASTLASAIGKIGTAVPWLRNNSLKNNQSTNSNTSNINNSNSSTISTSSGQQEMKVKAASSGNEPPETMTCRFALSDIMRQGYTLINSPNKALSVVSDSMGRVILINNRKGIALRMWKGYRDAQCGWIEANEDKNLSATHLHGNKKKNSNFHRNPQGGGTALKTVLYLIIYAPKKGIIDIWSIQQGGKITTFTACKNGRLIYINYGIFGLNDIPPTTANKPLHACIFMDPLGGLKEITVPFHFALSSKNGKRARDIHLFKKLKTFMREEEFNNEKLIMQVKNICGKLKTNEIRMQIILMLMSNKHTTSDALLSAVDCFITDFNQYPKDDISGSTSETFYRTIIQLKNSIKFYKYIKELNDSTLENINIAADSIDIPDVNYLSKILLTSPQEIDRILKLFQSLLEDDHKCDQNQHKVTFKNIHHDNSFLTFMSSFQFGINDNIKLITDINQDSKCDIASFIYQGWMYSTSKNNNVDWEKAARESNIHPKSMMELALIYWLNKTIPDRQTLQIDLIKFTELLQVICSLCQYSDVSTWWSDIRCILMDSTRPIQALTAALVCRSVEIFLEKSKEHDDAITDSDNKSTSQEEWENISNDTCQFTLLIGNLEDVSILNSILSKPPPTDMSTSNFSLPYEKTAISIGSLIERGRGSVTEVVAKWLSSSGIDPQNFVTKTDVEFLYDDNKTHQPTDSNSIDEDHPTDKKQTTSCLNNDELAAQGDEKSLAHSSLQTHIDSKCASEYISNKISFLKCHFPYSLTSSTLLANLCWEFVIYWSKDITELQSLETALNILGKIPSKSIRHGVCCLLWTIHIKKKMEVAAKLINKLGKLPKERLSLQELGLSDIQLIFYLQNCVKFLDIFLDSEFIENDNSILIKSEELWEGHNTGPQSFVVQALTQKPVTFDSIMLHFQLANVLHMIAHFNIKTIKPMSNLFDSGLNKYFFQDITDKTVLEWYRDDKRDHYRMEFLCKIITASIESIHQGTTTNDSINYINSSLAIPWMNKCQTLASLWKIDKDKLTIHQVYQLYINGFDRLAEEISTAINDRETLAVNLLPIAGRRMMSYLSQAPDLLEEISRINPSLAQYLENVNIPSVIMTTSSNIDTIELIRKVSQYLPNSHKDYHIVELMLEATFIYQQNIQ